MNSTTTTRLRLGIIGLGVMGTRMLESAVGHPDFEVTLVCDGSSRALARFSERYPAITTANSADDIISSPEIDAVYIATPPSSHAELANAAMRTGKAVFCEKPLAVSIADGESICATAAQTGVANAVNFPLADTNATLEIERAVAAGEVGSVVGVDIRLSFPLWPRAFQADATWLARAEQGGFTREVFSHFGYLTDRLVGPLQAVAVGAQYPADDDGACEYAAQGTLQAGDVPVSFAGVAGVAGPEANEWTLWGTKRSYRVRNWSRLEVFADDEWVPVDLGEERGTGADRLSRFAAVVRGGAQECLADFEVALRVQRVVEAILLRKDGPAR